VHDAAQEVDVLDRQTEDLALPQATPSANRDQDPAPRGQGRSHGLDEVRVPRHEPRVRCPREPHRSRLAGVPGDALVIDGSGQHQGQVGEDHPDVAGSEVIGQAPPPRRDLRRAKHHQCG